jgi:hypothetical protein
LAFCDSHKELRDSDDERVEFAQYYLQDLRFLWEDANGDNPKVCHARIFVYMCLMILRNGGGSFVVPSFSRPLLRTSRVLMVLCEFLASMPMTNLVARMVGWAWLLPRYVLYVVLAALF